MAGGHIDYGGRAGWFRETGGPGAAVVSLRNRLGDEAFTIGLQAGMVDKRDKLLWFVYEDEPGYFWTAFASADEFVNWLASTEVPRVGDRLNFVEAVPDVSRLVFQVRDCVP